MTLADLPPINASLNALCTVLLITGMVFIKQGKRDAHRNTMIAAFAVSAAFLTCYLIYHIGRGGAATPFKGLGWIRPVYYTILITHVILAMVNLPLILMTFWRAYKQDWERHKRIAKWTLPIWLYVSVTGVVVYWMLYQMYV